MPSPIRIDVWSDIVCPWCYIGKRRLEAGLALARQEHPDIEAELVYHAFQLDPTAKVGEDQLVQEVYERKFGGPERAEEIIAHVTSEAAQVGLDFRMAIAKRSNTILGHRLLAFALSKGRQPLMQAYFTEGAAIGQLPMLLKLVADVGLDPAEASAYLEADGGEDQVAADLRAAADHEITAVPTYVFNEAYAVPGALDSAAFANVFTKLHQAPEV